MATFRLLLAHDIRLGWREFRSNFRLLGNRALIALALALACAMHAAAWATGTQLAQIGAADAAGRARVVVDLAPGLAFILLLMLAQTLSGLTKALYGRGDLDLLLCSPAPVTLVLALRVMAVALGAMASAAIFAVPVMDVALWHGGWRALALMPVLLGAGLATAGVGLLIVMALFATLGPRRTRLAAQIVATFVGGGFMIYLQVRHLLPATMGSDGTAWPASLEALRLLPMRAGTGDGGALFTWLVLGLALFLLAVLPAGHRFAAAMASAAVIPARIPAAQRPATARDRRFETRLGPALRAKEWRLIARDPWLISQLLLQVLYMTPMLLMLMSGAGPQHSIVIALAPMVVVVCYQVTASVTWLSLSAEDAPELLATAPLTTAALRWGKLKAVAALAAMLAALPMAWLAWLSPKAAIITGVLAALGVVVAMLLSVWHTRPAPRARFAARHRESKLLAVMEMVMSMLLGIATALAVVGSPVGVVPVVLAGIMLAINRPRRKACVSADHDRAGSREARQQPAQVG